MSADPTNGVVDADCRVHGIANLYIGGSSVFASTGFVNPTYTIVQLALRLGDHVAAERRLIDPAASSVGPGGVLLGDLATGSGQAMPKAGSSQRTPPSAPGV